MKDRDIPGLKYIEPMLSKPIRAKGRAWTSSFDLKYVAGRRDGS